MTSSFFRLLIAQFLSAFADNAVLFTIITLVMHRQGTPLWYVPALQSAFLVSFVVLAPWSGHIADRFAKSRVLLFANVIKASGGVLLLCHLEPLVAYAVIGFGAALYSPAKYGILPELVDQEALVKANSWIEGSTILAILLGMLIGAKVADRSTDIALQGAVGVFLVSALITCFLPRVLMSQKTETTPSLRDFYLQVTQFLAIPNAVFIILGGALFWACAATLRVLLIAWAPMVFHLETASDIAALTVFLALGIVLGSGIVPLFISLRYLSRAYAAAYGMGLLIIALSFVDVMWVAQLILLLIGAMGGIFIVPINAALQYLGVSSVGAGHAVAMQGFFHNVAMLCALGSYSYVASQSMTPIGAMLSLGVLFFFAIFIFTFRAFRVDKTTDER